MYQLKGELRQAAAPAGKVKLRKFVTIFDIGGTERQVVNLGQMLDRSRFDLSFSCFKQRGDFLAAIQSFCPSITEHQIKRLYDVRTFRAQLRFAQALRRQGIDIMHSYNFYPNVFAVPAARLAGVPVVVASIRDTGVYQNPMQSRLQMLVCRLAHCVMVNADAIRQKLIKDGYDARKIAIIRNGIDLAQFGARPLGRLRQELGLGPTAPLIAVLARLNPLKGIEFFLDAAAIVSQRFPESRFLVVGDDPYRVQLERYTERLGLSERVVFTGFRLDVPQLLSELTVSVLPSLSEGLSNTLLESMAAGVPVVATRVGGNPEAVEDGVTGFLVPPRDPVALAKAITLLLENRELARGLGAAGKSRVRRYFSLDRMVRETEALYLRMFEQTRRYAEQAS